MILFYDYGESMQLLSKDDDGTAGAIHSVKGMPYSIMGSDGQRYDFLKGNAHAAIYVGTSRNNQVTIHDNDINHGGHSASVMGYVFKW